MQNVVGASLETWMIRIGLTTFWKNSGRPRMNHNRQLDIVNEDWKRRVQVVVKTQKGIEKLKREEEEEK
jgi:hypothetical protein